MTYMDNLNIKELQERLLQTPLEAEVKHLSQAHVGPSWSFETRRVPEWHMIYIHRGEAAYEMERGRISLQPGRLILLAPETAYAAHPPEREMHFFPFRFRLPWPEKNAGAIGWARQPSYLAALCTECWRYQHTKPSAPFVQAALTMALREALLSLAQAGEPSPLQQLLQDLHEHPLQRISLQEMAQRTQLQPKTLARHFHRETGHSPIAYLVRLRLQHAGFLLDQTQLSVAQVAQECGYSDPYLFSRQFKAHQGHSPSAFRSRRGGA